MPGTNIVPAPASSGASSGKQQRYPNLRRGNPGGGGGRRPSAFTKLAQQLVKKHKLLERMALIAAGEPVLQFNGLDENGSPVVDLAPARAADQLNAAKLVFSYAEGLPVERVEHSGEVGSYVVQVPHMPSTLDEWRKTFTPSRS